MRLALDARAIYRPQRRGIGKTLLSLYQHVALLRPQWDILAYHRQPPSAAGETGDARPVLPANVRPRFIEMPGDRFDLWQQIRLPWTAWREGADVLHCPANTCPRWCPLPMVVTVHDLIPLEPAGAPAARRFHANLRHVCRGAACIVCPSAFTRDRLARQFGVDSASILINPWAPQPRGPEPDAARREALLRRYGVQQPFVLHFGAADARKNTPRLLKAWSLIEPRVRAGWGLLVVGLDDATRADLHHRAADLGLTGVTLQGFAPEADLPALLAAADVLAYPSLSEGFGLPVLDAFAAGTPVLTSAATSLPEVAGHAAVLVDPQDTTALARHLAALMASPARRAELARLGRQRVGAFTWDATARRFIAAIESAAGSAAHALPRAA